MFSFYFRSNLLLRILIGLVLGGLAGVLLQEKQSAMILPYISPLGDVFIRLLKMIVLPVIIASLVVGSASIEPSRLGKVGVKILSFYILTSVFAIIVGLLFGNLFQPGTGLHLAAGASGKSATAPNMVEVFTNMIPKNPFNAISSGSVLPTIVFCLFFGLSLAFCRESTDEKKRASAETVFSFFEGMSAVIFKVVAWVMEFAPIGVFALIFTVFAKNGSQAFGPLLSVTGTVYVAFGVQCIVVYGLLAAVFKLSPPKFFKRVASPLVTAFVTRSSTGTLAVSMDTAENKMGIHRNIYGFTLPIGATINMDGTTIYLGVCAVFIANAVGMPLDFAAQTTIITTAVLASIGTAGVPGAGAIMLLMVLQSVGMKIEEGSAVAAAYAMIFGIDALLDMGRTSMNVVGDILGTAIVAKSEKEMDMDAWKD